MIKSVANTAVKFGALALLKALYNEPIDGLVNIKCTKFTIEPSNSVPD